MFALRSFIEALAQFIHRDVLAFPPYERRRVDHHFDRDGRFCERNRRQLDDVILGAKGVSDVDVDDSGEGDDISCSRILQLDFLQP